jgi:hypothetical protein
MGVHDGVKKFQMQSQIGDDSSFIRQRETQEKLLTEQMRDMGYVPVLDLGPFWSTSLLREPDDIGQYDTVKYESTLTMYGTFVGKRKACQYLGMDGTGRYYPISTQKSKSNRS